MKKLLYSSWLLSIVFVVTASIMAVYETVKELIFKGKLTPWQSHTITILITAIIAMFTASIMRSWVLSISLKEKEIESKERSLASFELILFAVNHIVNNVLNHFQLVKIEIDENGKLPKDTLELLEKSVQEADKQMKVLNQIQSPHDPKSYQEIYPK